VWTRADDPAVNPKLDGVTLETRRLSLRCSEKQALQDISLNIPEKLILLDEPCSALDPIATAKIEKLMSS